MGIHTGLAIMNSSTMVTTVIITEIITEVIMEITIEITTETIMEDITEITIVESKTSVLHHTTRTIMEFISLIMMNIITKDTVWDTIPIMTTIMTTLTTQRSIIQNTTECTQPTTMAMNITQPCM